MYNTICSNVDAVQRDNRKQNTLIVAPQALHLKAYSIPVQQLNDKLFEKYD
jgi:hypothetical protein